MNLLSTNDFKAIHSAMLRHEEICLLRTLRDTTVRAVTRAAEAPWPAGMIVQIQMEKGNILWIQNFMDVEEAKRRLDRWDERFHWI